LSVAASKGHLIVEEALDKFLDAALFNPAPVWGEDPEFYFKGKLALSLGYKRDKDQLWSVLWAINQLRNKIAHELDSKKIDEKMQYLR
jgi:hypothetical protein